MNFTVSIEKRELMLSDDRIRLANHGLILKAVDFLLDIY